MFVAHLAGFTSICSCLISATNSHARTIFNSGREGFLPSVVARLTARRRTPWVALSVYLAIALGLSYVFGWNTPQVTFFGEIATMGTILIALTYLAAKPRAADLLPAMRARAPPPSSTCCCPCWCRGDRVSAVRAGEAGTACAI